MKFFKLIFSSKNKLRIFEKPTSTQTMSPVEERTKQTEDYSSEEMIQNASDWTNYFLQTAPQLDNGTYQKDEIYMFCCWILLDYGVNHGYLDKHSNRDCFILPFIKQYVILANIINQIQNSLCLELTNTSGRLKKC